MLYVRRIEIITDNDVVICKIDKSEAIKGLSEALAMVKSKEGVKESTLIKKIRELDAEFKDYFNLK